MNRKSVLAGAGGLGVLWVVTVVIMANRSRPDAPAARREAAEPIAARLAHKPRLPAPRLRVTGLPNEPAESGARPTNWLAQALNGDWPFKPTRQQLEPYLEENRRSAESLLAAFRATDDRSLLEEAAEKYPGDPQVAFVMLFSSQSPEERRRWLEALKQAAPDNALAQYLSAADRFKSGQTDLAVQELVAASAKLQWQDYSGDFIQNAEEAYRAAGYSEAEAKAAAGLGLPLPQLARLRDLGRHIGELANLYRQAGDEASAQAALEMGVALARRISQGSGPQWMIQDLVGIATERRVLEALDPGSLYDTAGRTVKDRLEELSARRDELRQLGRQAEEVMQGLSQPDLVRFLDRWKVSGELAALRWAANKRRP